MENLGEGQEGLRRSFKTPLIIEKTSVESAQLDRDASASSTAWLAALHANNNNNALKACVSAKPGCSSRQHWDCENCEAAGVTSRFSHSLAEPSCVVDAGGGAFKRRTHSGGEIQHLNGAGASLRGLDTDYEAYDVCGATSLTPSFLAHQLGDGSGHSSRTSVNNSTENLSYTSDNYCADDLILLEDIDVDDVEAEELSLNSDDCVYAYRGDGTDFDLGLQPIDGLDPNFRSLGGGAGVDEETDFLEMDFEPDPLSEVDFANSSSAAEAATAPAGNGPNVSGEAFLMQRDAQLLSSPPDDLLPAPKALQAQSILSKNFARITLHLDQIQGDGGGEQIRRGERIVSALDTRSAEHEFADITTSRTNATAHSLPNTLHTHFGRVSSEATATTSPPTNAGIPASLAEKSPSKVTGAKPKRLSTFSSTFSSTSSKNSSKSRNSVRFTFTQPPPLCSSLSFDERSASCAEFRTSDALASSALISGSPSHPAPQTAPRPATSLTPEFNVLNEETCLDCLEKEFLASTIGKSSDAYGCVKCRKRIGNLALYAQAEQVAARCRRSASPTTFFLNEALPPSRLFSCELPTAQSRKRNEWNCTAPPRSEGDKSKAPLYSTEGSGNVDHSCATFKDLNGAKVSKSLDPSEVTSVTVSTLNLNEVVLVQALDKLHVCYSVELIKAHFKNSSSNSSNFSPASATTTLTEKPVKDFKNLLHFLLHVSKSQGNHSKLKRLIRLATQHQVDVKFKKATTATQPEFVDLKVSDVLYQWGRTKNLEMLKQLDKRFIECNVLGKIANIIRQAQQRCSSRRPLPEFISIPQYYPNGYLTLTKKC